MKVRAKQGLKVDGAHHFPGEPNEVFEVDEAMRAQLGDKVGDVVEGEPVAEEPAAEGTSEGPTAARSRRNR